MKTKVRTVLRTSIGLSLAVGGYLMIAAAPWTFSEPQLVQEVPLVGKASVSNLQTNYERWSAAYGATEPAGPVVTLLWSRGLSSEYSKAKGIAQFNLTKEIVSVRIKGLEDPGISDVWLVDNQPGFGRTVMPEAGDKMVKVGRLQFDGDNAWLNGDIAELEDFQVDLVVVTRRDANPGPEGVLYGTTSLFQKIYHYPERTQSPWQQATGEQSWLIGTAEATGLTPPGFFPGVNSNLINKGRALFFKETFNGNGRTCGTCHKEDDNMALGIKTIARLPKKDPLFIVEQPFRRDGTPNPLYKDYRMEKPVLMRKLGLILENLDGFTDPDTGDFTTRAVMRAPNHVLSVRTTLAPPPAAEFDDGTLPVNADDLMFAQRTGWSGDGTPTGFRGDFFESNGRDLTGSLRDFTIGAIVQHFTLTLERSAFDMDENGNPRQPDFRFATEKELDAMEAFMLSIGRQEENQDLKDVLLLDEVADRGRLNYMGFNVFDDPDDDQPALNCNACHFNGGGNTNPNFSFPKSVTPNLANGGDSHNRSFGPQVERLADQAGDIIVQMVDDPSVKEGNCFLEELAAVPLHGEANEVPGVPSAGCDANPFDNGFAFGFDDVLADQRLANNRFNAPPVFEAMDNPPFFHGHQINTVEGSVAFYATNRYLRNGDFLSAIVPLNGAQVINVARFMRVMGADFNAESAITLLEKARRFRSDRKAYKRTNIRLALAEIEDAVELLEAVELHFDDAVPLFEDARKILATASRSTNNRDLDRAIMRLEDAQDAMISR